MSRRPNRDPLPLHKPEACSKYCNGLLLRVDATYFKCLQGSFDGLFMGMEMRWSLTYVATPIAVAVREALFTSSDLINLTRRGAQSSFQCTASVCTACLGSTLPSWIVSALSAGMRLLRLAHSIWDRSVLVGVVLFGPVSPGSWPGGAWVPWRALPWCLLFSVGF